MAKVEFVIPEQRIEVEIYQDDAEDLVNDENESRDERVAFLFHEEVTNRIEWDYKTVLVEE